MNVEKAISKKRKIYGIDPNDFSTPEEFYNVINPIICDVCNKKIKNITRHLEESKKRYKKLLLEIDRYFSQVPKDYEYYEEIKAYYDKKEIYGNWYEKHKEYQNNPEYCNLIEHYLNYRLNTDLDSEKGIMSIINYVRKEIMPLPDLSYDESGNYQRRSETTLYEMLAEAFYKDKNHTHPIEGCVAEQFELIGFISPRKGKILGYTYNPQFKQYIDLLIYISELRKQLEYYQAIIKNPSNAIKEYIKRNNSWNAVMQHPYWIRLGRDTCRSMYHPTVNVFMIKPGTKIFDRNNIKTFIRRQDKKFEQQYQIKCDMMTVTIPDSLDEKSLEEVIKFAHENGTNLKFICQSTEMANKVKYILVQNEISCRSESGQSLESTINQSKKYYIKGYYWINIDPEYYESFFVDTPNNKNLWNKYGENLKSTDKSNIDIRTLIDICIKEMLSIETEKYQPNDFRHVCGYSFRYADSSINRAMAEEIKENKGILALIKKQVTKK